MCHMPFTGLMVVHKSNDETVGVHVHNIQFNFWKPDRVSATEGQLPAGGP